MWVGSPPPPGAHVLGKVQVLSGPALPFAAGIPTASFLAVVAESPFDDDLGLTANEEQGFHLILGIVEEAGDAWK